MDSPYASPPKIHVKTSEWRPKWLLMSALFFLGLVLAIVGVSLPLNELPAVVALGVRVDFARVDSFVVIFGGIILAFEAACCLLDYRRGENGPRISFNW